MYMEGEERLQRLAFGTADVRAAVSLLRTRGVEFMDSSSVHVDERGAVTQGYLGGLLFELVRDPRTEGKS